jgi:hypothetical protein
MTGRTATALGWRIHSSAAVVVAVSGPTASPVAVYREQVTLTADPSLQEPYHAAVGLPIGEARVLISSVGETAATVAASIIRGLVSSLGPVASVGVVGGDRPVRSDLTRILTKHALLHASERDLYEHAVIEGATRSGLPVTTIPAKGKETVSHASEMIGFALAPVLESLGQAFGSPWPKDHREAAAAALVALQRLP